MHFSIYHFYLFLIPVAAPGLTFSTFSPLEGVTIATTEEEAKSESKSSSEPMDIDGKY